PHILYKTATLIIFFQAKDGIRDKLVTGVQTCALPISASVSGRDPEALDEEAAQVRRQCAEVAEVLDSDRQTLTEAAQERQRLEEIGRASCREREEITWCVVTLNRLYIRTFHSTGTLGL